MKSGLKDSEIEELKKNLEGQKLKDWDSLPNFGIYMEQVLLFLKEPNMCIGNQDEENFTKSMINNYIKKGLVPHCDGKKYTREHLAFLVAISLLKQVMTINDAKDFLDITMKSINPYSAFHRYQTNLNSAIDEVVDKLDSSKKNEIFLAQSIINFAAKSYAYKFLSNELLKIYKERDSKDSNNNGKK